MILPSAARAENAKRLASALSIPVAQADEQLAAPIVVSVAPSDITGHRLAREVIALLARTFTTVDTEALPGTAAEIIIGTVQPRTTGQSIFVVIDEEQVIISASPAPPMMNAPVPPPLLLMIGACYICAAVLKRVTGISYPFPEPFVLDFHAFGLPLTAYGAAVDLGEAYLAGAGAVGNGFLWAARHLDLRGQLHIVDDDIVDSGNLQRQMFFLPGDENRPKSAVLTERATPLLPGLSLIPHRDRLQALAESGPWLRRLISAVDSREARRSLQKEMPGEVFDASTTDIEEVVVHHHRHPTETACMACIYSRSEVEVSQQQHIADHLGLSLEQVQNNRIDRQMAVAIAGRFPGIVTSDLEGLACDSLYKRLCGAGLLTTPTGKQVLAPFAFVSVLAGALLSIELLRRLGKQKENPFNIWRVGCWSPPLQRLWRTQGRTVGCEVCGDPGLREISRQLWGNDLE